MNLHPYALAVDILLIAVFAWTVFRAWKRGFVDAVSGLVSVVGAVILSRMFGFILEGFLQRKFFDPIVCDMVAAAVENAISGTESTAESAVLAITQALDGIRTYTDMLGIPLNLAPEDLTAAALSGIGGTAADALAQSIASPIAETLASWSAYLLLFAAAYLVLRLVFRMLNLVMSLPLLNGVNSLLGCVCGVLLGAVYAFLAARLLAVVLGILVTRGTLPPDILGGTVFGLLSGNQPL